MRTGFITKAHEIDPPDNGYRLFSERFPIDPATAIKQLGAPVVL